MVFTIWIILRVVRLSVVSSAYLAQSPERSEMWQSVQFRPSEAAKNPMVPMNSLTEIPLRDWTFVKTCSAIWPRTGATHRRHASTAPDPEIFDMRDLLLALGLVLTG